MPARENEVEKVRQGSKFWRASGHINKYFILIHEAPLGVELADCTMIVLCFIKCPLSAVVGGKVGVSFSNLCSYPGR